ncbi:MAG: DNA-invertase hin [Polaribacter sp. SA4-10]|nr:MAG: DNA-invertase hin [Polaribacter sp. SA4-10]
MNILYTRTSTIEQNSDRQSVNHKDYDLLIEDKCSGTIPFFEREGGKKIMGLFNKNNINSLTVHSIDRLGRDLLDILNTIKYFTKQKINIYFKQQGINTLDDEGKESSISKLIISILGTVAEMERKQIRERQLEGIAIAKAKGVYKGRNKGTKESTLKFLNKEKNKKAVELLNKNYKQSEVAKIVGLHPNTVFKIYKIKNI